MLAHPVRFKEIALLPEFMDFKLFGKTILVVNIQFGLFFAIHSASELLENWLLLMNDRWLDFFSTAVPSWRSLHGALLARCLRGHEPQARKQEQLSFFGSFEKNEWVPQTSRALKRLPLKPTYLTLPAVP